MSGDCIELVDLLKSFNDSLKDGSFPNKDGNTNKSNTLFSFSKNPHTNTSSSSEKDTDSNVVNSEEQTQGKFITCFTDYIQERRSFILDLSYLLYYGYFRSNSQVWQDTAFVIEIITAILSRGHEVYIAVDGKPVRKQMDKHYKENRKHTDYWSLHFSMNLKVAPKLYNYLYKDATVFLKRKEQILNTVLNTVDKRTVSV